MPSRPPKSNTPSTRAIAQSTDRSSLFNLPKPPTPAPSSVDPEDAPDPDDTIDEVSGDYDTPNVRDPAPHEEPPPTRPARIIEVFTISIGTLAVLDDGSVGMLMGDLMKNPPVVSFRPAKLEGFPQRPVE